MALLQISEPGQSTQPHQHRLAVGIDLGTTNSLVATVRSGEANVLPDEHGNVVLPSVVHYQNGQTIVGQQAYIKAKTDPNHTFLSVKRFIGRSLDEIDADYPNLPYDLKASEKGLPLFSTPQGWMNSVQISADILRPLIQRAEQSLGGDLQGVVITVPAYFDDAQRQATKEAAKLVGVPVMRLLNEPTAAAIAYGLDQQEDGVIAVYDLGGGTFDVSILRLNRGVFEVLATGGNTALGGDDFDQCIVQWIAQQVDCDVSTASLQRQLLLTAREAKEQLTQHEKTEIVFYDQEENKHTLILTRHDFDAAIQPLLAKSIAACRRTLRDAGIQVTDVDHVVLVGGSTRVLRVRSDVEAFFKKTPLTNIDPDRVVALGAAIQADILVGNRPESELLLLDVIPLSLGLETMGGLVEKVIPRNTTIPVARAQEFTTFKDGQTAMSFHVVQGERELVDDCRSLARFELRDMPAMNAGVARIRVTFQVDADGLLNVQAQEQTTQVKAAVDVKPSFGLTEVEIASMLKAAMNHAQSDVAQRMLAEQRVEADRVLESLTSALNQDQHLLTREEFDDIDVAMQQLREQREKNDVDSLKAMIKTIDKKTQIFASRRMDASMKQALQGLSVDDIGESDA